MKEIQELRDSGLLLSLDELVAKANELLPHVLPDAEKLRQSELNPRLVRHFATLGLLDEAGRSGREARYSARHLLQLLVVRRLMAEGSTTSAVKKLIEGAGDAELENLLLNGVRLAQVTASPAVELELPYEEARQGRNEALEWLQRVRSRSAPGAREAALSMPPPPAPAPNPSPASPPTQSQSWRRIGIDDGLEINIREDFRAPGTPYERERLLRRIEEELKNWLKKPRGKTR